MWLCRYSLPTLILSKRVRTSHPTRSSWGIGLFWQLWLSEWLCWQVWWEGRGVTRDVLRIHPGKQESLASTHSKTDVWRRQTQDLSTLDASWSSNTGAVQVPYAVTELGSEAVCHGDSTGQIWAAGVLDWAGRKCCAVGKTAGRDQRGGAASAFPLQKWIPS